MPSFQDEAPTARLVKGLLLGDGGAGKTTSLKSLVAAGKELWILDFDNLLTPLAAAVRHDSPEALARVHYQTFTDALKAPDTPAVMQGMVLKVMPATKGTPNAYAKAMKQLDKWTDVPGEPIIPGELGANHVVVIDTLTSMATAAYRYVQSLNPLAKEPQTWFYGAQQLVMNFIQLICSSHFQTHVLVLAHLDYDKDQFEVTKGFPKSIGSALRTSIANNFNSVLLVQTRGNRGEREILHTSTGIVDLKNPAPYAGLPERLPGDTGLADFFRAVESF